MAKNTDKSTMEDENEDEEEEDDDSLQDPLVVYGYDIMLMILNRLDARSLASMLLVSRSWRAIASSDIIWSKKCEELWAGKAHLPRFLQTQGLSKLSAYSLSVQDGKRSRIMKEDLWDHAWEFHFKEEAPEYWRNLDPYWTGDHPPMRRYFHRDGTQTADSDDQVWGGHESCYSVVTSFMADGRMREHYVRINRWPQMHVSRRHDWGWEMSNHLYCYSSVPDAHMKGGTGPYLPII
ncbi:hypothetical protein SSX86_023280 [Deinandra increscens subsp. villosa]|uniref:F-box domain-containing protein n=1 Tax=Deinandra increscens subsp. villosa TaxID=3103831 RepID=A0AAP0GPS1_9ASTR